MGAGSASPTEQHDQAFMRRALALAEGGLGLAAPNPMVGAVVVSDGEVAGVGWHEGPGTPHAEVLAIRAAGERARGATLFVTLEPCAHHGRTPPCAPLVVDAGVARVVAGVRDPHPLVDGRGFDILRRRGVAVTEGVLEAEARDLIAGFARHALTGLPFVTLKVAASLDGRVAARDGSSRWITGEDARNEVHRIRAAAGAVVVGAGTALADDPALTVRLTGYRGRQPLRVVIDGAGRVPARGALFDGRAPTLVATSSRSPESVRKEWTRAGAEVAELDGTGGRVSLQRLMELLGKREVQTVLIEGGSTLAWGAVSEDVVDRLVFYLAPRLIGGERAPGMLGGDGVASLADALPVAIRSVERVGRDVRVVADVHRDR